MVTYYSFDCCTLIEILTVRDKIHAKPPKHILTYNLVIICLFMLILFTNLKKEDNLRYSPHSPNVQSKNNSIIIYKYLGLLSDE